LIHRFVVILLLYTNQYDSKRQLLCSLRNTVEEIVKLEKICVDIF